MNNRYEILQVCDVPEPLDSRILAAAANRARHRRTRRMFQHSTWTAAAAVFLLAGAFLLFHSTGRQTFSTPVKSAETELLAMTDWSEIEQESWNLSFELYSGRLSVAELSNFRFDEGFDL